MKSFKTLFQSNNLYTHTNTYKFQNFHIRVKGGGEEYSKAQQKTVPCIIRSIFIKIDHRLCIPSFQVAEKSKHVHEGQDYFPGLRKLGKLLS